MKDAGTGLLKTVPGIHLKQSVGNCSNNCSFCKVFYSNNFKAIFLKQTFSVFKITL